MTKATILPIEFNGIDCFDNGLGFYDVKFLEDWGPFKKGEEIQFFNINIEDGFWYIYDKEGEVERKGAFKLTSDNR